MPNVDLPPSILHANDTLEAGLCKERVTETVTSMETGEPVRDTRYGAFAQHAVSGGIWYSEATWPQVPTRYRLIPYGYACAL